MNNLIEIGGVVIHADADGRFSLNDLHRAAVAGGVTKDIRPNEWMALDQTKALVEILITENPGSSPLHSAVGRYGGTYACKELIYAYAMWISAKFHIQVIRTFDAFVTGRLPSGTDGTLQAAKLFPPLFKIARLLGCDKQAAAISANQAVNAVSGQNLLALMGQTHVEAENQDSKFYTPTELGKMINTSARGTNLLLAEAGFQMKRGEHWEVTDAGKDFARIYDTGKRHGSGVPVQQIKWSIAVLPALGHSGE
ncbi:KilA-N domain-containing protein [Paraburkholderia sp. RL17-383-BIF-A]|uniref:KilA-N domain-containing protein n=1 Tax=Paraburkholderia sp. RL17-383-BIF-A TaxID=3031631 RepID=UPI0038B88C02